MLDPPSRQMALILFAAISCCAFCTRAARCSFVIGVTPAVIDFNALRAGCMPPPAAAGTCACCAEAEGEGEHAAAPRPRPAAAPVWTKERRVISMACILHASRNVLAMLDERAVLQLGVGLLQFVARVHHDRTVPRHRLFER